MSKSVWSTRTAVTRIDGAKLSLPHCLNGVRVRMKCRRLLNIPNILATPVRLATWSWSAFPSCLQAFNWTRNMQICAADRGRNNQVSHANWKSRLADRTRYATMIMSLKAIEARAGRRPTTRWSSLKQFWIVCFGAKLKCIWRPLVKDFMPNVYPPSDYSPLAFKG